VCYRKHCSRNQQNQGRRSFTSSPAGSAPLVQSWLWLLLRENLPPEHSHSVQGVARTPPETLTARTGVALQQATPVSRQVPLFVPLFDSHTHTLTLGCFLIPQARLQVSRSRVSVCQASLVSGAAVETSLSWLPLEREPKQRNPWAIIPPQSKFPPRMSGVQAAADPMVSFGSGGICPSLEPIIVFGQAYLQRCPAVVY